MNLELKQLKREIAILKENNSSEEEILERVNRFNQEVEKKIEEFKFSRVNLRGGAVDGNNLGDVEGSLERYFQAYQNFQQSAPRMIKQEEEDLGYDFDFELDEENYDPWEEYRLTYRNIFKNGRKYYILKSIPEWKFLQIGRPKTEVVDVNERYALRNNMKDSIFNILAAERYHDERHKKQNLNQGVSTTHKI